MLTDSRSTDADSEAGVLVILKHLVTDSDALVLADSDAVMRFEC